MPKTGDMAWAASPMHSSPGRCQRRSLSSRTSSSLTSSQEVTEWARSASHGTASVNWDMKRSRPSARRSASVPLGISPAHCQ